MATKRAVCLIGAALVTILITNQYTASAEDGVQFQTSFAQMLHPVQIPQDNLDIIVDDATRDGGSIVRCENHHCLNLKTKEDMGDARDGWYVVFPTQDPQYKSKLERYQKRIQNWMNNQ